MSKYVIGVLVGSLRKDSYSLKIAKELMAIEPEALSLKLIDISNLPMFNQDLEAMPPKEWVQFKENVKAVDGLLFITPEYNRSVPAVLKNAIDVGSRPYGDNSWNGKPAGIVSVSIGTISGFGANLHLRQSLTFINALAMAQPEAYIGNATELFNEKGELSNDRTKNLLKKYIEAFEKWVATIAK